MAHTDNDLVTYKYHNHLNKKDKRVPIIVYVGKHTIIIN